MNSEVAVIRERWVTESELQNYEYINNYNLTVIGSKGVPYDGDLDYKQLYSPGSVSPDLLMRASQVVSNAAFGSSSYMYGLKSELQDYDIAHVAETFHGFSEQAIDAKQKHGCSVVCTVWENIPFFSEDGHYSKTIREKLKHKNVPERKRKVQENVDSFIAVTQRAQFALEAEGVDPEKITVIPVGVDINKFCPEALSQSEREKEEIGLCPDETGINVVFVGRYPWFKGVYDLLSAWKVVEERVDRSINLTMVGSGDNIQLQKYADRIGVENVNIMGKQPYEMIPLIFSGADISVVPSVPVKYWQEQYGRVIVESQATATPVIASATGGIPDAAGDPGVLINPGDAYDIANKLESLIEDDNRRQRLARQSRERIESNHALTSISDRIQEVYDEI